MIDTEFAKQTSLDAVAQAVVDRVKRIHGDTFASGGERAKFCPRHEDMTLLVRNFGYPLGEMSQPTASPAPGECRADRKPPEGAVGRVGCGVAEAPGLLRERSR